MTVRIAKINIPRTLLLLSRLHSDQRPLDFQLMLLLAKIQRWLHYSIYIELEETKGTEEICKKTENTMAKKTLHR